ncbi:helix-turn-helix domain-containing protein [Sporosarcina sp. ACRSL]|uniref:helix-turn-helix transcriptional regulator n=1 Tax=Sporosarcina sp. ACRSL TaxID=2918215 RepID=UPI001EF6D3B8|nr:helix-turn-helix transcriptional regulator [Sporosarcina sp. ACRSL]MCG7346393.1 helix-turn-helix domain-containing protein [Sporosarcina sp. ACRSL]
MENNIFKDMRLQKRMTQKEFADALGLSQSTVAHIEAGRREISYNTRTRLAQIVDVQGEFASFFERLKEIERVFSQFNHTTSISESQADDQIESKGEFYDDGT